MYIMVLTCQDLHLLHERIEYNLNRCHRGLRMRITILIFLVLVRIKHE